MRKLIFILLLIGAIFFINSGKVLGNQPLIGSSCSFTRSFKIGVVDPRFKLSEEEFLENVNQAAGIWNTQQKQKLFNYDKNGQLTINLVYDERQALNTQIGSLENDLKTGKSSLDEQIAEYEKQVENFKNKLASLNSEIESWNSSGGAPQAEYENLIARQQTLKQEGDALNNLARKLNLNAQQFNTQVKTLNQTVDEFNNKLHLKPEEGIYDPNDQSISVYFNISQDELVHTLTHEFGHALGIDHNTNPKSIMYPYTTTTTKLTLEDLSALDDLCKRVGINGAYRFKALSFLNQLQTSLKFPKLSQ